jgi:myo-inositol 2-dehydrogenase/D-chiro-inositol 1-dehydrogenase
VFTTPERMGDAFVTMLQSFVDCIVDDTEPPVSSQDGRATLSIAIAARHSIQTRQPVTLDEQPIPPDFGRDLMKKNL